MIALLHDPPRFQNQDLIGTHDRAQSVGDHQAGPILKEGFQGCLNGSFALGQRPVNSWNDSSLLDTLDEKRI